MRKSIFILTILLSLFVTVSCTKEKRAKAFGGSFDYELPENQKLITVTWKEDDLWVLYRPMKEGEVAETYTFKQNKGSMVSVTGNGSVKIIEKKTKTDSN
jgi:hypothetical protein